MWLEEFYFWWNDYYEMNMIFLWHNNLKGKEKKWKRILKMSVIYCNRSLPSPLDRGSLGKRPIHIEIRYWFQAQGRLEHIHNTL